LTITLAATALSEERARCEHFNGCAMYIARPTRESFLALHRLVLCARVPPAPVAP
jgi:hypothetical protein